jgi:hypothetical protein
MDTAEVRLGAFLMTQGGYGNKFVATVSNPNSGMDENPQNDATTTTVNFPPQYPAYIYIELKTNNHSYENEYFLTDDADNIIKSRTTVTNNTIYKDTLTLANGCYKIRLTDSGEDGLNFWANPGQGSGYFRIRNAATGAVIKSFGADFGSEVLWQFTVGYFLNTEELPQVSKASLDVYPNPTDGEVWADLFLPERGDAEVFITDLNGREIQHQTLNNILSYGFTFDLKDQPSGVYLLNVVLKDQVITKKILITR